MRILWISYFGSWTRPLAEQIAKSNSIEVIIPSKENKDASENGVTYHYVSFSAKEASRPMTSNSFMKFQPIIQKFQPDVIHVHGTEKNLAQVQNFTPNIPVIVSIQGLVNGCIPYTTAYVDKKEIKPFKTLKNLLGFGGLSLMERTCRKTAIAENQILQNNRYFFGRTDFDKAHILMRNPKAYYFIGGELLRQEFYMHAGSWKIDDCEQFSIFMPSGFNPIKGMHLAIKAVLLLKQFYPQVKLYVPGVLTTNRQKNKLISRFTGEEYIRYAYDMIEKNGLSDNVIFRPRLIATQMVDYMKKAHVFLAPSSIDNSPNAVGEASMIGCPIVTTPVGGIPSFMKDGVNAILSPAGDPYMLAYNIKKIFENDELAVTLGNNAHKSALKRHDIERTTEQYIWGYSECIKLHRT